MYAKLTGICIKTCGGIWGRDKTAAAVKAGRGESGGYAGEEDGTGAKVPPSTASPPGTAVTQPQQG